MIEDPKRSFPEDERLDEFEEGCLGVFGFIPLYWLAANLSDDRFSVLSMAFSALILVYLFHWKYYLRAWYWASFSTIAFGIALIVFGLFAPFEIQGTTRGYGYLVGAPVGLLVAAVMWVLIRIFERD